MQAPTHSWVRPLLWLALAILLAAIAGGCTSLPRVLGGTAPLTRDDVDGRAAQYFQRGMDQYQKGDFRGALDSFRLAKAYDTQGTNPLLPDMLDKAEAKVLASAVAPGSTPIVRSNSGVMGVPTPTPLVDVNAFRTYRSRLYPMLIDVPADWLTEPKGTSFGNEIAELIQAPGEAQNRPGLMILAVVLPADADARAFAEGHRKILRSLGYRLETAGTRTVDGQETGLWRATVATDGGNQVITFAIFSSGRIGWSIGFGAPPDQNDKLQPLFHKMLDSFRMTTERSAV